MSITKATYNIQKFTGVPLEYYPQTGYYGISFMQVRYYMPESIASKLASYWKAHTGHVGFNISQHVDVKQWYDQLPANDRQFVVRFSITDNQYL